MSYFSYLTILLLAILMTMSNQAMAELEDYRWRNRLLLVFATGPDDSSYQQVNQEIVTQGNEIADRDLIVFHIFESGKSRVGEKSLPDTTVNNLRHRYQVKPGNLTLILIGKDGGEKLRQQVSMDLGKIFSVIDAMPMRKQEAESKIKASRNKNKK